jgi:hypothetical protein
MAVLLLATTLPALLLTTRVWPPTAVVPLRLGADHGIFVWNMRHMTESVLALRNPFVATDLYHPIGARLTKHSYALGFVPIGVAARQLTGQAIAYPITAMRMARMAALIAGLILAFFALQSLGAGAWSSLTGACAWVYSVFFGQHIVHLHVLAGVFILPAVTLAALRLVRRPGPASAALLAVTLAISAYFSEFSIFSMLALAVACALAFLTRPGRTLVLTILRAARLRGMLLALIVFLATTSPILLNWSADAGNPARMRAAHNFRALPTGFVVPDPMQTPLYRWPGRPFDLERWKRCYRHEALVFMGFPVLLLAILAGIVLWRVHWVWLGLASVFLLLSLGPYARFGDLLLPLPFRALRWVPPFPMLRTPNRFAGVALWFLVCLAALGLAWLLETMRRRGWRHAALGVAALALLWIVLEGRRPGPAVAPPQNPVELARLGPGPVANVPVGFMDGFAMYAQIWHGRPILTGYVSRRTPEQLAHVRALHRALRRGPVAFARALRALGTSNVVLGPRAGDRLGRALAAQGLVVVDLRRLQPVRSRPSPGRRKQRRHAAGR